ncbi:WD40-repeat-containing domain protein [Choanephora cucurbitarum]|nr:WD40-repeat-containing domain protein [Choanephora cucurbitarum]
MVNGQIQTKLTGHLADVTTVQFFPSNLVVLTGGTDFLVKIWSVLNGSNPVTLKGHTSAITSTAIIAQGRNVLSSSRDGTVRLWNCGTSSTIATIGRYSSSVNKMILTSLPSCFAPAENATLDPLEVETSDKLVLCALEDGSVRGIHLGTKEEIFATSPSQVPLTALAYDSQTNTLLTGNAQGLVQVYAVDETKTLDQPQRQWKRNGHAITGLLVTLDHNGERVVCVSAGDGSIFQTNSLSDLLDSTKQVQVLTELTGNELETVYEIKAVSNLKESESQRVVCAVRDGKIRIY